MSADSNIPVARPSRLVHQPIMTVLVDVAALSGPINPRPLI